MTSSGSRHTRRRSGTREAPPRPPLTPPSSTASSAALSSSISYSRLMGRCRGAAPLSSVLMALSLTLVGYITWKEVSSSVAPEGPLSEKVSEGGSSRAHAPTPVYSIEVVNEYHHDPRAFTQGLLYAGNNRLFESTGLYGQSSVREVLLQTGKVQAIYHMDSRVFGEGLTLLGESQIAKPAEGANTPA